ncbi:MAG: hypothetical protein NC043_07020 [Muribaculaceae bacterium]|nr:hypothetical protein [Muribaculaceae bacterium]
MSNRRRINISLSPQEYDLVQEMRTRYGYRNACEMIAVLVRILTDRIKAAEERIYDIPESDGEYIDTMFDELAQGGSVPYGAVPKRTHATMIPDYGKR